MTESIVLGGGCFWCTEAVFWLVPGVERVAPGYAGGRPENPSYEQVCTGLTGHAEVVKVEYDGKRTALEDILAAFFAAHDPTTLNRQGGDVGTQYRSVVFYTTQAQKIETEEFIKKIQPEFQQKIVTEVRPLKKFYPAEEYHEKYFEKNPNQPYCRLVVAPKVEKIRKLASSKY